MATLKGDGAMIFMIFLGALIGTVLLTSVANDVFFATRTNSETNITVTVAAAENGTVDLQGRDLLTTVEIYNATDVSDPGTGLALRTAAGAQGLTTVQLLTNATSARFQGQTVNISYTYNPDGFLKDAGARAITVLIVLFGALAILVFVVARLFDPTSSISTLVRSTG